MSSPSQRAAAAWRALRSSWRQYQSPWERTLRMISNVCLGPRQLALLASCVSFLGLPQPTSTTSVAYNYRNLFSQPSGGQNSEISLTDWVKIKTLVGLCSLQRLLGESFLPLPAAGSPGVPWLMAASLQSLLPASHYLPPCRQTTLSFLS